MAVPVTCCREVVGDFKAPHDNAGAGSASEATPPSNYRDVTVLGDCDEGVDRLAELLGWRDELDELVAAGRARHPQAFARSATAVAAMRKAATASKATCAATSSEAEGASGAGAATCVSG